MFNWLKSKLAATIGIAKCPKCGGSDIEKTVGGMGGRTSAFIQANPPQEYRCKSCGHTWTWNGLPPGVQT